VKEIGECLRKAREEKELSLKDIQEITKIRLQYLEAMEEGNFEAIPGEVYRKGFLVNFANAVGLDGQQLLERYYQIKNELPPSIQPVTDKEKKEITRGSAENAKRQTKRFRLKNKANFWAGIAIIIFIVVSQCLIVPLLNVGSDSSGDAQDISRATEARSTVGEDNGNREDQSADEKTNVPEEMVNTQVFPAPITVYAEFTENVWVRVKADGKYIYMDNGVTFTKDSPKQVWTAQESLEIRVGNSGGIKLTFNGKEVDVLGKHGVSQTYRFTPEGLVAP